MSGKVVHIKQIGAVKFLQNRRSKNIKISVKPDKTVLVSFPFYCTSKEVLAFVDKNGEWIRQQQQKMGTRRIDIETGSIFNTKQHTIEFVLGTNYNVDTKKSVVKIIAPDFNSERTYIYIEDIITQIYRFEANLLLPKRLQVLAQQHGFKYERLTIRNNKRNWGSCSSKNNISLNLQMMKLPDQLIDYILLHELVHTEIKNHGPKFWERLNEVSDNKARVLAKEVKQFSTYVL